MDHRRTLVATIAVLVLAVVAGCAGGPVSDGTGDETTTVRPTPTTEATTTMPDALDSTLAGLVQADDRDAYAETHDLDYDDGRVAVVVELQPDAELPEGYDLNVTARHDELVQAWVQVEDLPSLASEEEVRFVRPPHTPEADGQSGVSG
ncbi:ABC-type Fe3+-hydroxamate transport system, periplasmic component [Halanaeroarchaeum sp. HSR-CO]|uniref:hypothetical protein n=1 Tax=Halanaeroarchaeum sp. HSR-CO TaxID=2866382 RepID=UPI00217EACAB|nr:hypothetical protein [Halanaeroarchaeum sp. HSR-CO]UWG46958.1 ABC-type Fe3+-hydroxamate transport system, periplasmic component [Halanaeroarchaeum sp. HSR-CO]